MELLLAVLLTGLISGGHGHNTNGTFSDDEQNKCWGCPAKSYLIVDNNNGTILNNTNQGTSVNSSDFSDKPSVTFSYEIDEYNSILLICVKVKSDACSQPELVLWFILNILNGKVDDGDTIIKYTKPPDGYRCAFIKGKQCKHIPPGKTNQCAEEKDIPKLIEKYELKVCAATYFQTEIPCPPKPSPEPCPPKPPKEPCPPKDPKDPCPPKDPKEPCPPKDPKEPCPPKDPQDPCPPKDPKEPCPPKDPKKPCPPKDPKKPCPPKDPNSPPTPPLKQLLASLGLG